MLSYHMPLRCDFHVVTSSTLSARNRCLVRLYPHFVVGEFFLIYVVCVCLRICVHHVLTTSNMACVLEEAGHSYPSQTPVFTSVVVDLFILLVSCVVFLVFFCLGLRLVYQILDWQMTQLLEIMNKVILFQGVKTMQK